MRLIISPAKKMKIADEVFAWRDLPQHIEKAEELMALVRTLDYEQLKKLWKTSDALTQLNFERFQTMDVRGRSASLSPAIFAYEGMQYQHMAPAVMEQSHLEYIQNHVRILSGFYGVLRPFDGVVAYRLEMQAKLALGEADDMYGFWADTLAQTLAEETELVVNLASKEYAQSISSHIKGGNLRMVTCLFGFQRDGRLVQRATAAKAARGSMVRWCAERGVARVDELRAFDVGGYCYQEALSDAETLVFTVG